MNAKKMVINKKIAALVFLMFCRTMGGKIVYFFIKNYEIHKFNRDLLAQNKSMSFPYLLIDDIALVDIENYIRLTNDYSILPIIVESHGEKYLVMLSNLIENPTDERMSLYAERCINWIKDKEKIQRDNPKIKTFCDYCFNIRLLKEEENTKE
jgi:hypothetical protein